MIPAGELSGSQLGEERWSGRSRFEQVLGCLMEGAGGLSPPGVDGTRMRGIQIARARSSPSRKVLVNRLVAKLLDT